MPTDRIDEIVDRLAEMELALPGLAERSPGALHYLTIELAALIEECSSWTSRWERALEQSRQLERRMGELGSRLPEPR